MQWFARWMTQKTINEMDRKNLFEKHFLPIPILFLPVHRMVQNNYTFCHSCVWLNVQQLVRVQEPSRQEVRSAHGGICTQAQAEEKPSHPVISCFTNNRLCWSWFFKPLIALITLKTYNSDEIDANASCAESIDASDAAPEWRMVRTAVWPRAVTLVRVMAVSGTLRPPRQ